MVREALLSMFPALKSIQSELESLKADVGELRRTVRDLKVEVKDLRGRLDLGGAPTPRPAAAPAPTPAAAAVAPAPAAAPAGRYIQIREEDCIGCGTCVEISDKLFDLTGHVARVLTQDVPDDVKQKAVEACPVTCIVWSDTP